VKENIIIKNTNQSTEQCQQLLKLFESQLEGVRQEILDRADSLGSSFEGLFDSVYELQMLKGDQGMQQSMDENEANIKWSAMNSSLVECVSSLQFTDAVCQRIEHLSSGIHSIRELMNDDESNSDAAWHELTKKIKESYSVKEEKEIFDKVIHGTSNELNYSSDDIFND
jgi:hypothetical protein